MLEELFEEIYCEAKKKGRRFFVDKEILVTEWHTDENGKTTEMRYPIKIGSYVENVVIIAQGTKIRKVEEIRKANPIPLTGELANAEDWKKVVGNAILVDGEIERKAEIHWYQCNGVGKCMMKVKRWKK